jgi:hypothetical protein
LLAYEGVQAAVNAPPAEPAITPVLPMHFRKGTTDLRLFTTIATLGIPQDITLQELRIESFFPMDEATARVLRGWIERGAAGALSVADEVSIRWRQVSAAGSATICVHLAPRLPA